MSLKLRYLPFPLALSIFFTIPAYHSQAQFADPELLFYNVYIHGTDDIDNDGDMDYFFRSMLQHEASQLGAWGWLENNGDTYLRLPRHLISSENGFALNSIADMDGDGDKDALGVRENEVGWYSNENNGQQWVWTSTSFTSMQVKSLDLDRDGDMDILLNPVENSDALIAINQGGGVFSETVSTLVNGYKYFDHGTNPLTDVDGDGISDVVISHCNYDGIICDEPDLRFFLSSQDFGIWDIGFGNVPLKPAVLCDFDQSGFADVLFYKHQNFVTEYEYYLCMDPYVNGFNPIPLPNITQISDFFVGDFDVDGDFDLMRPESSANFSFDSDLIFYTFENNNFQVNNSLGTIPYSPPYFHTQPNPLNELDNMFDFDADGDLDFTDEEFTQIQNSDGTFRRFATRQQFETQRFIPNLRVGMDIDGDGIDELLANDYSSVYQKFNDTQESLGYYELPLNTQINQGEQDNDPTGIFFFDDINSDGYEDYISSTDTALVFYVGSSLGLQFLYHLPLSGYISKIEFEDMNGDSFKELIIDFNNNGPTYYVSPVGLDYSGPLEFLSNWTVNIADMDNDGDRDFTDRSSTNTWFENTGSLPPTEHVADYFETPVQFQYTSVWFDHGDFNGDGLRDYFYQDTGFGYGEPVSAYVLMTGAEGMVTSSAIFPSGEQNLYPFDYNGDGFTDYLNLFNTADSPEEQNHLQLIKGNPFGTIIIEDDIDLSMIDGMPKMVGFADIDGDGKKDIIWEQLFYSNDVYNTFTTGVYFWSRNNSEFSGSILGNVFLDYNQNGVWDSGEPLLDGFNVFLNGDSELAVSGGNYYFDVDAGEFVVSVDSEPSVWIPTTPTSYTVDVSTNSPIINNLNFGFYPSSPDYTVDASLQLFNSPCGEPQYGGLQMQNAGNTPALLQVRLHLDELTSMISADGGLSGVNVEFDSETSEYVFTTFEEVPPTQSRYVSLVIQYPGVENLGDTLEHTMTYGAVDNFGTALSQFNFTYTEEITCSYDPNIKMVSPEGWLEQGFVLNDQELSYTVHFQNTGNAPAITVEVEDLIDSHLDLSSFQLHAFSHPVTCFVDENRVAHFVFPNINLIDSITDPVGSMGYISYKIRLLEGLDPLTEIGSEANIFFDSNPPITTNTTLNTVFDCALIGEFSWPPTTLCEDVPLNILSNLSYIDSYQWTLNDELVSTEADLFLPDLAAGSYAIGFAAINPYCAVNTEETFIISGTSQTLELVQTGNVLELVDAVGIITWYFNGDIIAGESGNTLVMNESGEYFATVTAECTSFSEVISYTTLNEKDPSFLRLYPNPVSDFLHLPMDRTYCEGYIVDCVGKRISISPSQLSGKCIDVSMLSAGVYTVILVDKTRRTTRGSVVKS